MELPDPRVGSGCCEPGRINPPRPGKVASDPETIDPPRTVGLPERMGEGADRCRPGEDGGTTDDGVPGTQRGSPQKFDSILRYRLTNVL